MAKLGFRDRLLAWRRSLSDPLRNEGAAARWIEGLPAADMLQLQHEALDLIASFPGSRRAIGPNQAEALLRIDARCDPVISHLSWLQNLASVTPPSSSFCRDLLWSSK